LVCTGDQIDAHPPPRIAQATIFQRLSFGASVAASLFLVGLILPSIFLAAILFGGFFLGALLFGVLFLAFFYCDGSCSFADDVGHESATVHSRVHFVEHAIDIAELERAMSHPSSLQASATIVAAFEVDHSEAGFLVDRWEQSPHVFNFLFIFKN
jgi:hypothetical protein